MRLTVLAIIAFAHVWYGIEAALLFVGRGRAKADRAIALRYVLAVAVRTSVRRNREKKMRGEPDCELDGER